VSTDAAGLFWPQVARGVGIMICLVPTTRLALGGLPLDRIPDASGLFNLMRNLGGAIGLASIDTCLYGRAPAIGEWLENGLKLGDAAAARAVGLPPAVVAANVGKLLLPGQADQVMRLVERAALTLAANEAWLLLALVTIAPLPLLVFVARNESKEAALPTWAQAEAGETLRIET
jgi:MFS transporter, DHA2 family, multidrug resistance protein